MEPGAVGGDDESGGTNIKENDDKISRPKSKSKEWKKWFSKKSRNSRENSIDTTTTELEDVNADFSPTHSHTNPDVSPMSPVNWSEWEFGSSSESDCNDSETKIRRSRDFPNSEIDEKNCIKPSQTKTLFHQLEYNKSEGSRPNWSKRKKKAIHKESPRAPRPKSLELVDMSKSFCIYDFDSLDESSKDKCCDFQHNESCDKCATHWIRRSISMSDLNLNFLRTNFNVEQSRGNQIPQNLDLNSNASTSTIKHNELNSMNSPTSYHVLNQFKSNSLPSYYRSKTRNLCAKCHLPVRPHLTNYPSSTVRTPYITNRCHCESPPAHDAENDERCEISDTENVNKPSIANTILPEEFKTRKKVITDWFTEFDDAQKNLILSALLEHCELPQVHLLSLKMESCLHDGCPPNCSDIITWLPQQLSTKIMGMLDPVSLCQASMVCKTWYNLASEPKIWCHLCCLPEWHLSRTGEQKQLINHLLPNGKIHWKRVFAERYRLRNNWLLGRCHIRTFEGHTQGISCVQFDDTRIVSGSSDKTIKVWNIRTNTPWLVQTLVGHSGTVRCLHLEGNRLVSGSTDHTIKVWDLSTQQSWSSIACKTTMMGHTDTVRCLQVDDEKVISGSYDLTLKIWDIRTGVCRMTLRGHTGPVLCVQFDATKIVSGSGDKTIKVWSFTGQCLMVLGGHHAGVTCLQFDSTRIISGSLDCTLKFWDISTGDCVNTIDWKASEGHTGVVRCLQSDTWRVVSASDDRTIKVWSLETGQRLVTLRNHSDGVTCLQFNDSIIVSGSYDKCVKLWDFSCC
ncbi:unnamed protein product [Owenia fusiformis]|uniref:F-box domain-containing protein n=1 Tax=Owenia fusiformis TaxID=6347 RepID=A0A8J1T4U9_OWEFU|nr:unnamed protein product [Owenia fusiformis]